MNKKGAQRCQHLTILWSINPENYRVISLQCQVTASNIRRMHQTIDATVGPPHLWTRLSEHIKWNWFPQLITLVLVILGPLIFCHCRRLPVFLGYLIFSLLLWKNYGHNLLAAISKETSGDYKVALTRISELQTQSMLNFIKKVILRLQTRRNGTNLHSLKWLSEVVKK